MKTLPELSSRTQLQLFPLQVWSQGWEEHNEVGFKWVRNSSSFCPLQQTRWPWLLKRKSWPALWEAREADPFEMAPGCPGNLWPPECPQVSTQLVPGTILILGASRRTAVGQTGSWEPTVSEFCWDTDQLSSSRKSLHSFTQQIPQGIKNRFSVDSKSKGSKSKNQQMGLYPTKKLLHSKGTIHKKKKQSIAWKKIFANPSTW